MLTPAVSAIRFVVIEEAPLRLSSLITASRIASTVNCARSWIGARRAAAFRAFGLLWAV